MGALKAFHVDSSKSGPNPGHSNASTWSRSWSTKIGAMMDTSSAFHVDQAMEIGSYFSNRGHTKTVQWSNDNVPLICDTICTAPI